MPQTPRARLQEMDTHILSFFGEIPEGKRPPKNEVLKALRMKSTRAVSPQYKRYHKMFDCAIIWFRAQNAPECLEYLKFAEGAVEEVHKEE